MNSPPKSAKLQEYIAWPEKIVYSQLDRYEMSIQHNHILSSSGQAYAETIDSAMNTLMRMPADKNKIELYHEELKMLKEIQELTEEVHINGKTKTLLSILKKCFSRLRQLKALQKTIVFVDNLTPMKHLRYLFTERGYNVLTFSGGNSRDFSVIERLT